MSQTKRNFNKNDGIHTRSAEIRRILVLYKVINKTPVNGFINNS